MFVPEADICTEKSTETLMCHLKPNKLHNNLIAYIRAQGLVMYDGPDVMSIKMLEPSELNYELLVLHVYKEILNSTFADNQARF
jgi:hypothetical protein